MGIESTIPAQHIYVTTEFHVVAMRQEVRQIARGLGLGLAEQAKIATAISTIARMLLARDQSAMFTLRTIAQDRQTVFEIACVLGRTSTDDAQPEQPLDLTNIRLLVDESALSYDAGMTVLKIRMRLTRVSTCITRDGCQSSL
jgi:hypothetical protein